VSRSSLRPALKAHQHTPAGVAGPVAWTPGDMDTELWLDASDSGTISKNESDLVSQWDDKSGEGNDLTQGTATNQPIYVASEINSLAVVSFDGVDNFLQAATRFGLGANPDLLIVAVVKMDANVSTDDRIAQLGSSSHCLAVSGGSHNWAWRYEGGNLRFGSVALGVATLTSWQHVAGGNYGSSLFFLNGTSQVPTASGSPSSVPTNTDAYITLGAAQDTEYFMDGKIGEILFANVNSTADRKRAEGYLAWKWGLAGSLPTYHPFKAEAPTTDPVAWTPAFLDTSLWLDADDAETVTRVQPSRGTYTTKCLAMDGVDDTAIAAAAWATPSAAYSVSLWARLPSGLAGVANYDRLITAHGDTGNWLSMRFCVEVKPNGEMLFRECDADSSSPSSAYIGWTNVVPTDGAWHHWAFTSEGVDGGDMKVYLDGSVVISGSSGKDLSGSPHALNLYVAAAADSTARTPCDVDEIAIYSSELPATGTTSVAALYNSGVPAAPPATGLINHLRMGDGAGDSASTLVDVVGNQDLTLANGAAIADLPKGPISQWADKSSNDRHLVQATTTKQPVFVAAGLNNRGVIRFDGAVSYLDGTGLGTLTDLSIAWVIKFNVVATLDAILNTDAWSSGVALHHSISHPTTVINTGWPAGSQGSDTTMGTSAAALLVVTSSGSTISYWLDGTADGSGTASTTSKAIGAFNVGSWNTSRYLDADIAELMVLPAALSTEDRQKVEGYLAHRWNITLPSGHPYQNEAPTV
jgi:hypothetical protein